MEQLFYTKDNYWVIVENDIATVGISNYVLDEIDIVNYVELPYINTICAKTDTLGVINYNDDESFNIYAPFTCEIIDVNEYLVDNCDQLLNRDIYNSWLFRIYVSSKEEFEEELMSEEEYKELTE